MAEFIGLGPLEDLLKDKNITEIMVNGYRKIYVEEKGLIRLSDRQFLSEESLLKIIQRIVTSKNRRIDQTVPYVDTRLDDGSRVNAIIPPLALDGAALTPRELAISGRDLAREGVLAPGPAMGACLRHLLAWVLEDPARNTRDALLAEARRHCTGAGA